MRRRPVITFVSGVLLVAATTFAASPAAAQVHRGRISITGAYGFGPRLFGPLWAPFSYGPYPHYGAAPAEPPMFGEVRVLATPRQAAVYIDGSYAGGGGNFEGVFDPLYATSGAHAVTLYIEGFRTVTENIRVTPDAIVTLELTMEKLGPGEVSAPPPKPDEPVDRFATPGKR